MTNRGRAQDADSTGLQLMTISKNGLDLFWLNGVVSPDVALTPAYSWKNVDVANYSSDGKLIAVAERDTEVPVIALYDTDTFSQVAKCEAAGEVKKIYFSPNATYLVTLLRVSDPKAKNVYVWNISDAGNSGFQLVDTLMVRASTTNWPLIRWSKNETICCRMMANAISISCGTDPLGTSDEAQKLLAEHVQEFSLSPEVPDGSVNIAVYMRPPKEKDLRARGEFKELDSKPSKDNKDKNDPPARPSPSVRIYNSKKLERYTNHRAFPWAEDCVFKWNSTGDGVTAITSTDIDITGKSYYGNTFVTFMRADSGHTLGVADADTGTVHDIQWSPTANEYCILRGPMPSELLLCEGAKGEPKTILGKVRKNTIRWDPFGQMLAIGGFGNLPGEIIIWDRSGSSKVSDIRARCTVECEWAPDGRHLLAATTSPRLRMDNCVKIFRYTGKLLNKVDFEELTTVAWRPAIHGTFAKRDQSPTAREEIAAAAQLFKESTVTGVYRPSKASATAPTKKPQSSDGDILVPRPYTRIAPTAIPGGTAEMSATKGKSKKKSKALESGFLHETAEDESLPATSTFFMPPPASTTATPGADDDDAEEEPELTLEQHEKQIAYLAKKIEEIKALKAKGGPYNKAQNDKMKKEKQFNKDLHRHQNAVNEINSK